MKRSICLLTVLVLAIALVPGCGGAKQPQASAPRSSAPESTEPPPPPFVQESFTEVRAINYASSEPPNNALLTAPIPAVFINFSKGLSAGSFIEVTRDGLSVTTGANVLTPEARTMYVPVNTNVTGNYAVKYAAYFPSGYYEEGRFGFSVKLE
ncbi:MAG: copper resistance protein CopC [Actinomycetota bacterium]